MSALSEDSPVNWSQARASSTFESGEAALEALVQLKDIELGDLFTNRDTRLDSEEDEGISITFFHDERPNSLVLRVTEDTQLRIQFIVDNEEADLSSKLFNEILDVTGGLTRDELIISTELDRPYASLDTPVRENADLDIVGLRIAEPDGDYIVQESESGDISVIFHDKNEMVYDSEFPPDFIIGKINGIEEFLAENL